MIARFIFIVNDISFLLSHRRSLLEFCRRKYDEVIVISNGYPPKDLTRVKNFQHIHSDISRGFNPIRDLLALVRLFRSSIFNGRETVFHIIGLKAFIFFLPILFLALKKQKLVVSITGLGFFYPLLHRSRFSVSKIVFRFIGFCCGRKNIFFIFQNSEDLNIFRDLGFLKGSRFSIISGTPVEPPPYRIRNPRTTPRVAMASRLIASKGIHDFVEIGRKVNKQFPCEFFLAGGFDIENPAGLSMSEIESWNRLSWFRYIGYVENVIDFFSSVDLVIVPSKYGEGFPRVIIEAGAAGRCCIGYENVGTSDAIFSGENGYLIGRGDTSAMVEAVTRLVKDHDLLDRLGKRAYEICCDRFGVEDFVETHRRVYEG